MLTPTLEKIPQELTARRQWVVWRIEERKGKPTKIPYNPSKPEYRASTTNPKNWGSFEQALTLAKTDGFSGIGYVFSKDDPYTGIDIDKCRNIKTGDFEPWAAGIIKQLGSYSEVSPSERGAHIIVKGTLPPIGRKKGKVEMYDTGRFFTISGAHLLETPTSIENRQAELMALHTAIFGKPKATPKDTSSRPSPSLELSDHELIEKARQATNGEKFERLWRGDISVYDTPSEADYALVHLLAYWTNKDPERIDRLFRQSGLCQDPDRLKKWERLANRTINKAIANTPEGYNPSKRIKGPQNGPEAGKEDRINNPQEGKPTLKTISAKDLGDKTFAPPRWAVPNLLPEGLIILAGKPKAGKSWLALNVAVAVASGGVALGKIQVEAGEVLYLALEDSERRLQERLKKTIPLESFPENLHFLTVRDFPPLRKGGLEALDNWLNGHPQARLVIIDTLARVKPARGKNVDAYDHDTAIISTLQTLSIEHRLALIVVHHTKKVATDDFVESVSGTFGLTGAADAIAVLIRKDRAAADADLKITGRDVADIEKALKFHPDLGAWEILGEAQEYASSNERQDILSIVKERGSKTPAELAKIIDKSVGAIRMLLMRMKNKGEIRYNSQTGKYFV